jgi:Na+/melibiose symporter-like transporter
MIANQGYGIAMALAGVLLTACRIFDGATDALIAIVFEKINPSRGKVRMFMLIGWAVTIFGSLLLYNWAAGKFDGVVGVVMFVICYVVFIMGYTFTNMGTNTAPIVITNDPTQRAMTGFVNTIYAYAIPMLCSNIVSIFILPKYDNQIGTPMLTETILWFAVISLFFTCLACFGLRKVDVRETFEVAVQKQGEKEKVTFREMWGILSKNRQVQLYMLTAVSDKLAQQTMSQAVVNTMMAGILIGSYVASTMVGNFTTIIGLVFAFGSGVFVSKMGAKRATKLFSWASIALSVAMVVYCFLLGGPNGMNKLATLGIPVIVYAVLMLLKSGSGMALTVAENIMRADVVDYECERSGKYMPSVVAGTYSFIDKTISAFGSTITLVCISLIGYANSTPQAGDAATWPIFWMTMFLMFGMPILGWICNIAAMRFYALDKERMVQVQKNISVMKEEAKGRG